MSEETAAGAIPGVEQVEVGRLRDAGFTLNDRDVRTATPWWSLPDLGIARRMGWEKTPSPPTELLLVARKPGRGV